jgi:ParB-like chromosome segregation protein Spo0J
MKVLEIPVKDINPAQYNPRKITDEELQGLRNSIKRFGMIEPLIVNTKTNNLVGGHQRLKALKLEGHLNAPVVHVHLNEVEEKALNVALNAHTIQGKFDTEVLADLLKDIEHDDDLHVFTDLRFDVLSKDLGISSLEDVLNDDVEIDEPEKEIKKCPHCKGIL